MADDTTEDTTAEEVDVDTTATVEDTDDTTSEDVDIDGEDALGDPGKKALDAMKAKWKAEREARRQLEQRIAAEQAEKATGDNPDPDAIRAEAEREAIAKANERILRAEIRAAAAGKLADPADALQFLDLTSFEVDADGNVDADEIADAIGGLVDSKPYLAVQDGKRFQGTADNGARNGSSRPAQLTREQLAGMSAEQIDQAFREGRTADLMSGK